MMSTSQNDSGVVAPVEAPNSVVKMDHVSFTYGEGPTAFQALKNINLTINNGEFVAITGSSGSGKTTLMNLIGTLATTTEGRVAIAGYDISTLDADHLASARNQEIGFIFQQFHLLPRLSVIENILLPVHYLTPTPNRIVRKNLQIRAEHLLSKLGIFEQRNKFPATLSGGQKQRVAIARALLLDPKILLADEPTGALDSKTSKEVLTLFAQLHSEGRTVIMITHDPEVTAVAHRKISLADGQIVSDQAQPGLILGSESLVDTDQQATAKILPGLSPVLSPGSAITKIKMFAGIRDFIGSTFEPIREAWQALISSRLRTFLTSLGLTIGVAAITTMITLGNGAREVIVGIFNQAGADRIYIGLDYGSVHRKGLGYWPGLDFKKDLPSIQRSFAKVARIVPANDSREIKIVTGGGIFDSRYDPLFDVNDLLDSNIKISEGRSFAPHEFNDGAPVALVGSDFTKLIDPDGAARRQFGPMFPLGFKVALRGNLAIPVTIVGIVQKRDTTFDDREINSRIYLPHAMVAHYTGVNKTTWIAAIPNKGISPRWLADSIKNFLSIKTGMKYPFRAHVPEEFIDRIMMIVSIFQGLTALIGSLCILVGGIGIMNIMLVTITERIKEIGLRKAVGASGPAVTRQFLVECLFLCFISGIMGTVFGSIFCNVVAIGGHMFYPEYIPNRLLIDPTGLVAGLLTAIICGITFGMMPALKAARMDPSEALRSE